MELLKRLIAEEEGQNLVEYALMLGVVVLAIYLAITFSGVKGAVSTVWSSVASALTAAPKQ